MQHETLDTATSGFPWIPKATYAQVLQRQEIVNAAQAAQARDEPQVTLAEDGGAVNTEDYVCLVVKKLWHLRGFRENPEDV